MAGWWDSIFGNLPPPSPPARPTSRGALLGMGGYQQMPDMTAGIEDRRTGVTTPGASQPTAYNLNAQTLSNYPPRSHAYNVDQWRWLQKNMPDDLPTTPLPDPGAAPDASVNARIKAAQAQQPSPYWMQPAVIPPGPRSGPQFFDNLFGNPPPPSPPARPTSRGATFGAASQAMPMSQNVDDRQSQGHDYTVDLRKAKGGWGGEGAYSPSDINGAQWSPAQKIHGYDPLVASPMFVRKPYSYPGAYAPSYGPGLPPNQPYSAWDLPTPRTGFTTSNDVPYIGPHLPISPGDPGWTSPPSLSGPHNPGGDPNRPGYGMAIGLPNTAASQPSYQQMIDFLSNWRGGAQ